MRHSGVLPGISLYKNRKINRHALHFVGGIFFPGGHLFSFFARNGLFLPRFGPVRPFGPFRPGVVVSVSGVVVSVSGVVVAASGVVSPRRAMSSPCRALFSPRRALLSPRRALLSPAGVVFTASGVVVSVSGVVVSVSGDGSACLPPVETYSGRKKVRKPSASGLFFGLSVANYFARAFRLTSLAALSASFGFFEMALLS